MTGRPEGSKRRIRMWLRRGGVGVGTVEERLAALEEVVFADLVPPLDREWPWRCPTWDELHGDDEVAS